VKSNNVIFLSHPLSSRTPGYGGKQGFFTEPATCISCGDSSNSQKWTLSNHIGTHIDCPKHFSENGKTLDQYTADEWIFKSVYLVDRPAQKADILGVEGWCQAIPASCDLLLIRTGFEKHRETEIYWQSNPGVAPELAVWLRTHRPKLRALGMDFISITSYQNRPLGRLAHKALLAPDGAPGNPILAIKDMMLSGLESDPQMVIVSPMIVTNGDGGPVTIFSVNGKL
jgi:arylformamidase